MKRCWAWLPYQRPSFKELENLLSENLQNETLITRIEVSEEINESNYELEIGKRDETEECGDILTNGHANGDQHARRTVDEIKPHSVSNGFTNGQIPWKPWSGDIHVHSSNDNAYQQLDDAV